MTSIRCAVCAAITDAMLCKTCTAQLEQALAELPADLTDLQAVATGQASGPMGLGDPLRQWEGRPTADALDVTPWMFAPGASDLLWTAANTLTTWIRHLCESRGIDAPQIAGRWHQIRRLAVVRNRWAVRYIDVFTPFGNQPVSPLCAWLVEHVESVRQDEAAAQIHDEITWLHAAMDAAILGRSGLEEFYGCCDRPDVRVQHLTFAGPRCFGLTGCAHDSCALVRGEHEMYTPTVSTCGAQLNGREDAAEVTCPACGEVYATADRKSGMLAKLPDKLGTIREVAGALSSLDRPVHVEALLSAVRRNRIPVRGYGPGNERLVRVGDVEDYLEKQAERSATRRKITAA